MKRRNVLVGLGAVALSGCSKFAASKPVAALGHSGDARPRDTVAGTDPRSRRARSALPRVRPGPGDDRAAHTRARAAAGAAAGREQPRARGARGSAAAGGQSGRRRADRRIEGVIDGR